MMSEGNQQTDHHNEIANDSGIYRNRSSESSFLPLFAVRSTFSHFWVVQLEVRTSIITSAPISNKIYRLL